MQVMRIQSAWSAWLGVLAACLFAGCNTGDGLPREGRSAPEVGKMPKTIPLYVGTYTGKQSKGIYRLQMDLSTGALTAPELAVATTNPSFLAVHPSRKYLYAVEEVGNFGGQKSGAVSGFAIEPDGRLGLLNQQPSQGPGPCYLSLDKAGRYVFAANYSGGSSALFSVSEEGLLGEPGAALQHSLPAASTRPAPRSHAHSIDLDPAGRFALAADLGLDCVLAYHFDAATGALTPNASPALVLPTGSGPRHVAFGAAGRFVYVINETANTVVVGQYDADHGTIQERQTISTLPEGFKGESACAEIQVHPNGRFLYASNRGHDSIAVFAIDAPTGKLTLVECQPSGGKSPRHFEIDPSGTFLLAANQNTNNLVVFRIDARSGKLTPTGVTAEVPSPVCVKFVPPAVGR